MIFQDPFSSLNPRMTILQIVGDPLTASGVACGSEVEDRVAAILRKVGLSPSHMRRYPHAFSGGERQRVNIARALIVEPQLVIADEAVSALDVSVRAQILNLLRDLQDEFDLTYLFISHDMSVVESICNRVAVMYLGKIVELAETEELYERPAAPLHRGAAVGGAPTRPAAAWERSPDPAVGQLPGPRQPAGRMLLPHPLPLCGRGALPDGAARAARGRRLAWLERLERLARFAPHGLPPCRRSHPRRCERFGERE